MMQHKLTVCVLAVVLAFVIGACPASGQFDAYLKVGDIQGDATASGHEHWSEIMSYDMSVQNEGWQPGSDAGNISLSDMYVTKLTDEATPLLLNSAWTGQHHEVAWIDVVLAGAGQLYLQWEFSDVVVSGYNTVLDSELSAELVVLDFRTVRYTYHPQSGGPIEVSYDRLGGVPAIVGNMTADFQFLTQFEATPAPEPVTVLLAGAAALALAVPRARRLRHDGPRPRASGR